MGEPTYPDQPIPTWEEFQQDYSDSYFEDTGNDKGRNFIILLGNAEIGTIGYDNLNKQLSYFPQVQNMISGGSCESLDRQPDEMKNLTLQVVERRLEDLDQVLVLAEAMPL